MDNIMETCYLQSQMSVGRQIKSDVVHMHNLLEKKNGNINSYHNDNEAALKIIDLPIYQRSNIVEKASLVFRASSNRKRFSSHAIRRPLFV